MKKYLILSAFVVAGLAILSFSSCGSGSTSYNDGGTDGKTGTVIYQGAGSVVSATLRNDNLTFDYSEAATVSGESSFSVSGTFVRLASGFLKFTITTINSCSNADMCPKAGDAAYGMEIPGMAILIKPIGGESNLKPALIKGFCPTTSMTANWVKLRSRSTNDPTISCNANVNGADNWFGTFSYDDTTKTAALPASYDLAAYDTCTAHQPSFTSATCTDGAINITQSDGGKVNIYLTKNGGAVVHVNPDTEDAQIIIGFPVQTLSSLADLEGNYLGLVFSSGNHSVFPVKGVISGSTITGYKIDADTGERVSGPDGDDILFALGAVNTPSAGFIEVSETTFGGKNMACQAATKVGASANQKTIINCIAQDNTAGGYFNLLLVQE